MLVTLRCALCENCHCNSNLLLARSSPAACRLLSKALQMRWRWWKEKTEEEEEQIRKAFDI